MKARASCPFTSRSGPITDHSDCGPIVAALTYWTPYGMRGVAPATPLVCRPAPPGPPGKGPCGISAGWKRRAAPHENEKSLQNPDSRAGSTRDPRRPAVVCAYAGYKR